MSDAPGILLIDDGELDAVVAMLDRMHIVYTRMRGGRDEGELAPPSRLLIATPRHASSVRRGSPAGAAAGRPTRIIAVDEDSKAMRRMLRRMGFHLLVRRGAHADVWRLLVERAMFDGDDRREDERMPFGATVALSSPGSSEHENHIVLEPSELERATLVDISNRGCRLRTSQWLAPGAQLSLEIALPGVDQSVCLTGRLVRSSRDAGVRRSERYTAGMLFDDDLPLVERERLGRLLNDLSLSPGSLAVADPDSLPECESPLIPGLTLDAETDPALPAGVEIGVRRGSALTNRRQLPRGSFTSRVLARSHDSVAVKQHVLMGRDLSAGGMRVEHSEGIEVGCQFELAIYGPGEPHPFLVRARVERNSADSGMALKFTDVSREVGKRLEKLVACLPDIESLEDGERGGLGAVISEILSRTPAE